MLFKARERREELRSSTYLEIILIVVIILVLLVFDKEKKIINIKADFDKQILDLQKENTSLKTEIRKLKREGKIKDDRIKFLENLVSTKGGVSDKLLNANEDLKEEVRRLKRQIAKLEEELEQYKKGQDIGVKERGRCRLTSDNTLTNISNNVEVGAFISIVKIQDSFEITVADNFIYKKLLVAIPALKILENKNIFSVNEFKNFGSKLLAKANENNCYLVAKVKKNSIDFNDLNLIERYFYKSYY
tara:strand:+ start:315 stop:1052 length:738 start_codon:yes stop_codon:yes gene_type:complete